MDAIVRNAIARIEVAKSRGTGFLVAPDLVLTAVHVVADRAAATLTLLPGAITLTFPTHTTTAAIVDGLLDARADWILLRCATPPPNVRPIPLADSVEDGAAWETFGFPDANPRDGLAQVGTITNAAGSFEGISAYQLFSDQAAGGGGAPVKGASGGPVIVDGAVVGLLRASLMKEGLNVAGTLYGCPVGLILDRTGDLLPIPDPYRGLPGLPRLPLPASPFRFLEPFTADDAEIFFGRSREIRQLYQMAIDDNSARVVLLFGQSGCGKSSLLDAGMRPRLEGTHATLYMRRDRAKGLLRTLMEGVASTLPLVAGAARAALLPGEALRLAWLGTETAAGRPLIVVLDHLEEAFTLPSDDGQELAALADALAQAFAPGCGVRGRLVVGFRKEWFADIQTQLDTRHVDYGKVFLDALDAHAVTEVVSGLTRTRRLKEKYGLDIEEGLSNAIARDLTADRDSPVAPTLQVLMSRLWKEATAASVNAPQLTLALYERVRNEGFLLGDFLDQQLVVVSRTAAADPARADAIDSGLALDVLAFHTSPYIMPEQRTAEELAAEYRHRAADVAWLVQELKSVYVLADPGGDVRGSENSTRLAGTALAQVVRARFDKSGSPGQRARRILENRAPEWADGKMGKPLDARDLELVEQGLRGMRALRPAEDALLEASRDARDRERWARRRRLAWIGAAAATLLAAAAVTAWFGIQTRKQREWSEMLTLDARIGSLLTTDPVDALVAAINVVDRGLTLNKEVMPAGLQTNFARALDSARERFSWPIASDPTAIAFAGDGRIAAGTGDGIIHLFQVGVRTEMTQIRAGGDTTSVNALAFSPDGAYLAAALGREGIRVWDREGQAQTALPKMPDGSARVVRFAAAGADPRTTSHTLVGLFTAGEFRGESRLYVYDFDADDATTVAITSEAAIESMAVARTSAGGILAVTGSSTADNDADLRLWDARTGTLRWKQPSPTAQGGFSGVDIFIAPDPPRTVWVAGAASDGTVTIWNLSAVPAVSKVIPPFAMHPVATTVTFGALGRVLLVGTGNGGVHWLNRDEGTDVLPPFSASSSSIGALAASPDRRLLAVGGSSLGAFFVRLVDQVAVEVPFPLKRSGNPESHVWDMKFAPGTHHLFVAGHDSLTRWDLEAPRGAPWSTYVMTDLDSRPSDRTGMAITAAGDLIVLNADRLQFRSADGHVVPDGTLPARASAIALSPDSRTAVVGDDDGNLTVWDVPQHRLISTIAAHKSRVIAVAFNAQGDRMATAGEDERLQIRQRDGGPIADIADVGARALAYHHDGTLFVGRKDGQLGHRRADGAPIVTVPVFRGEPITSLFVQRAHGTVVVGGKQGIARFDIASGAITGVRAYGKDIRVVAGSSDGRLLAAVDEVGEVHVIRADWQEWLAEACDRLKGHDVFREPDRVAHCSAGSGTGGATSSLRSVYGVDCRAAYNACAARVWGVK